MQSTIHYSSKCNINITKLSGLQKVSDSGREKKHEKFSQEAEANEEIII